MTPKTPDYGHRQADKALFALTKRLHLSYRQAMNNLSEKIENYLSRFEQEDTKMRALYDSGELSHEDYMSWRYRKLAGTKQWQNMRDQLTDDLVNADKTAASMINGTLPGVYAENHNYGTYEAERGSGVDTTYTLYDKDTVARLMNGNPDLLPAPSVDIPKDMQWNRQHLQSALLQGILTGESMRDIAKRFQNVVGMDERAAMRNARTAVTGAQNAGRIDSYLRAQKMGIGMKQVWMSTKDGRTRDSHAMMDGEKVDPGKKFSNGCRYPGDPHGHPAEIYNCRCTVSAEVEGSDPYDGAATPSNYLKEQGLTYAQWKRMHAERFYDRLFRNNNDNSRDYPSSKNIISNNLSDKPIDDIERFVILNHKIYQKYGFELNEDVMSLDYENVEKSLIGITEVFDEIPELKKVFKGFVVTDRNSLMSTFDNGTIGFSRKYYSSDARSALAAEIERAITEGLGINNFSEKSIGYHEAGHLIEMYLCYNRGKNEVEALSLYRSRSIATEFVKSAIESLGFEYNNNTYTELALQISDRALYDTGELFAECIADFMTNKEYANDLSIAIWKLIRN